MTSIYTIPDNESDLQVWYEAASDVADDMSELVPPYYRSRTFAGMLGDIKALSSRKALSLISRKKGLGLQYAREYLVTGIDDGLGYQACTLNALRAICGDRLRGLTRAPVLDVGCAIGVTAGILGLENIWGFDLFIDLLKTAQRIDTRTGRRHSYAVADMTRPWPFAQQYNTVFCGLVCHHLKRQEDILTFFREAAGALLPGGNLMVTLPSGSLDTAPHCGNIITAIEGFGFEVIPELTGIMMSMDSTHSLYWSFLLVFEKTGDRSPNTFIAPDFGFHMYRTPVSRSEKGDKARITATATRKTKHVQFTLVDMVSAYEILRDRMLVYDTVNELSGHNSPGRDSTATTGL